MNELSTINSAISSLEVAEMVEKTHAKLIRDIRRYTTQLAEAKIGSGVYWKESTYADANGQSRTCYLVSKLGCEFIAHKTTGTKGTAFTARYINRFHEMEDAIKSRNEIAATVIPEKSPSLLPKASDWYKDNKEHLDWICANEKGMTVSRIYHIILKKCSMLYDMTAAEELYNKERGFYPKYPFDVVVYFPQLTEIADKMIHRMEIVIRARQKIGMEG